MSFSKEKEEYENSAGYKRPISDFVPIVLPRQIGVYLGGLLLGIEVVFVDRDNNRISGEFVKYSSTNNTISLPHAIKTPLGIKGLGIYKVILVTNSKVIRILEISDK